MGADKNETFSAGKTTSDSDTAPASDWSATKTRFA
jgi:hypothetical protein